ncbi:protein-methionine sulfoxide oxidase mical3b isoform X4 [Astyanax mexicanus]|uniref:protein-methionine sulfoxide oxidase mical3b isoform X4 n=1 Tax=Astyanax mexicanus TaxID=7994 RepID=UPI0020CB3D2E|nr:protein-methionine sulfoxide oxidase mical3b isoform X4 [Astyanax mexicanus]
MGDGQQEAAVGECRPHALFDSFVQASTCRETLRAFQELCGELQLQPGGKALFYHTLRSRLHYWKAKALWAKLDKRASQREYQRGRACTNTTCLIIGAGPCGLRTAIELSFLGARVVLVEKRDAFSRNNVLHLWPFTIQDLRGLGAKKFYGKFCAGAIDHISIRQLQLMLLKVALLLGVEVHVNVEFRSLREPPENQEKRSVGWRAEVRPTTHAVSELQFDVVIGADGRRNTLPGFHRKEFRGKLAIAITANFINRNTTAEAKVEEISGVAFIFNQRFFQELRNATGIDLENIVYYKDDTHYFVMTAKKQSLLEKGVILRDYADTEMLLSRGNVDQNALLAYARQAADFSTNHQLPTLDFAINHYGQPDVAMFDFTCMYASENAALVRQRRGHSLLVALVGDSLLEPFWPMGTGIARGFLAAMDAGWMVRSWGMGACPLEVLAERESVYRLLPQTTPENVSKNYSQYSLDPSTRYPNINTQLISPAQVYHLIDTDEGPLLGMNMTLSPASVLNRQDSTARSNKLLGWCQEQTEGYRSVCVTDLTTSWRNGLALCALIHRYRPDLIDFDGLEESEAELNWQLGLEIAERELGVSPIMTIQELSMLEESDSLCMVMYLSQLHDLLKDTVPLSESLSPEERAALLSSTKSPMCLLNRLGQSLSRKRNPKDKKEKDADGVGKRRRTSQAGLSEDEEGQKDHRDDHAQAVSPGSETGTAVSGNQSRVRSMATQLLAKFEENAPSPSVAAIRRQSGSMPNLDQIVCTSPVPEPPSEPVPPTPVPAWRKKKRTQQQELMSFRYKEMIKGQSLPSRSEQRYIKMYTGGVSSLAEQIASQLHRQQDDPKPLFDRRELGSQRKEFPVSMGGSDVCYFCGRRVYVMERLSAEGKFFHRSCFQCDHCSSTLRLSNYVYDQLQGKFYCKQHYSYRLAGLAQRKRPAPTPAPLPVQTPPVPPPTPLCVDTATPPDNWSSSTPPDLAAKLAKRLCGTPERIELENYRPCLQEQGSPLEEVPEEMLAQHNLSLSKGSEEQSSSSESELEDQGEASWRRSKEPQATTNGVRESDRRAEQKGEEEEDDEKERGEEEEEEEVSEDEEEDVGNYEESSDESSDEHPDEPEVKPCSDRRGKNSCELQIEQIEHCVPHKDCSSPSEYLHADVGVYTYTPTSDLPVTPEDSLSKRTEVIEEFWMKSAEIRKSLGLTPMSRDLTSTDGSSTHSSSTGDTFYTSNIHTPSLYTTASDSPSHTPHKYNSSNCTRSTQTPSSTDFESSAHMHSSSGTPGSSRSGTSVAGEPGTGPEQVIARCSMVHRLNITLEGHVMEDRVASASNHVSRIIGNNHRDLAPESGLLTPPCSPPVARCYRLAAEPAVEREILLNSGISHPSMLQKDRLKKKGMVSVQRLPPDEVEVLCADEAHPYANATPVDATNQLPSRSSLMDQHKTSSFPNISSAPAPEHAGKDKREGRRTLTEGPLQVGGAEVWLRRPEAGKSGAEEKEKKRSSLFSPRKSRKGGDTQQETTKHKSLWKSVFSGYKKEKKRKEAAALAATLPSGADQESRRRMASLGRTTDLCFKKTLSLSEDSDLSCNAVMERSPLRTQLSQELSDIIRADVQKETIKEEEEGVEEHQESLYVPHALAFRRTYAVKKRRMKSQQPAKKTGAEEELDAKLTRRVQRAARRQAKQEELRRLHRAQIIQRQLEQVEVKQRQLEEKGIAVEKALRGEAVEPFLGSPHRRPVSLCPCCSSEARAKGTEHDHSFYVCTVFFLYVVHEPPLHQLRMGKKDDPSLMQQWFKLVQEKNALVRYESELMIFARELELEDRQSRLQQELRERMAVDDHLKGEDELEEEKRILGEMLDVVEQRDALVALLEEQRVREREEDSDLEAVMLSKGFNMHWA